MGKLQAIANFGLKHSDTAMAAVELLVKDETPELKEYYREHPEKLFEMKKKNKELIQDLGGKTIVMGGLIIITAMIVDVVTGGGN